MSLNDRRSSVLRIDDWLDKCSNDEPDSMLYEPDYVSDVANVRSRQKEPEIENLYKIVTEVCTKIGLPPEAVEGRLSDIDECITTFVNTIQKDVQDEFDKLCQYKQELLNQIVKMTSDLYLPPYIPEDNITLLQHCKRLKTRFNELNVVREKRMARLQELRDLQAKHCLVLGIQAPPFKLETDIPTEDELKKLTNTILEFEREEKRRKEKYSLLKEMIIKCIDQLEYTPKTEYERNILNEKPCYTESHLLKMSNLHSELEAQYAKNQEKFEKLRDRLISLYDRLDVPQSERDFFLETHHICKPTLMLEMEVEIERYEELKRQNIGKFIEKIKDELVVEYERCYVAQETQDNFFALSTVSGECNEELLALYERELERIKKYYVDNKEILERFQKWRTMWKELIEIELKANDPGRFTNRGGQLLLEERKRKTLQKGLPRIEKELADLNAKYSATNGEKFRVFDTNLDEFIAGCWDELNTAKEEEKRERQKAKLNENANKNKRVLHPQAVVKRTPTKRAAGAGMTPTPSKLHRSVLGTPSNQNTLRGQQLTMSSSVKKLVNKNHFAPNSSSATSGGRQQSNGKSGIPIPNNINPRDKTTNSNGSDFSALSLSEQEFEDMIVTCPASAKRHR